jgi:hypothetical protein
MVSTRLNRAQRQALLKLKRLSAKKTPRTNTPINARLSAADLERAAKQRKTAQKGNVESFMRRGQTDPKPLDRWRDLRAAKKAEAKRAEAIAAARAPGKTETAVAQVTP